VPTTGSRARSQCCGAVDRQADEEPVRLQELRPVVVEQYTVGLQVVIDSLPRLPVLLLQRDHLLEERETAQRRLAALPAKHDLVRRDARDVVTDEAFQDLVCHVPLPGAAAKVVLGKIEAVGTVEVARGTGRLRHRMEAVSGLVPKRLRNVIFVGWCVSHLATRHSNMRPSPGTERSS
jgi:hypothetical protein